MKNLRVDRENFRMAVGVLVVIVILLSSIAFSVRERHTALVMRFGKLVRVEADPGLHWKLPWPIDKLVLIDGRRRVFDTRHSEMLTRDKKNVILLSYASWQVADAELFYKAVGTIAEAENKLDGIVTNAKIGVLGRYDLSALVSTNPEELRTDAIEAEILGSVKESARAKYGIDVGQVGFKRLSLPEENIESVFDQMRAERAKVAAGLRAQGERDAAVLRAETDLEVAEVVATAREEAAKVRGEAEAQAAEIYAKAHSAAPELFRIVRQLQSLEKVMGADSTLIMRTDKAPFNVLNGPEELGFEPLGGRN
ncbi:MAG: protease modulator HflC [Thermoanaerobaculia bacterium]|nr:protease modulator HflC [Thermoanaerobaculia bacterium]